MITKYFKFAQTTHKSAISLLYSTIDFDGPDFIETANAAANQLSKILLQDPSINLSPTDSLTLANELLCSHD